MNREIIRLAVPNILSNVSVPLLSTFDTALMGRLSEDHIGAVGVGSMIFNFVYWNFGFLRMGSTGLTAQAYGRNDRMEMATVLGRAAIVAMVLAAGILMLQRPFGALSFVLLDVQPQQASLVADYFYLRVWAAPATLALYGLMGWFFGMQNAVYPLLITVVSNVINIVLSVYFVRELGMEARGVALGTVIAQYAGMALAVGLIAWRYPWVWGSMKRSAITQWEALQHFLRVNGDIFLRTLCLTLAFGFFYNRSNQAGEMALAANVILLQFLNWMSYGVDGFAYAAESLVGKYFGAEDPQRTRRAIRLSFLWGMGLAGGYALLYGLGGDWLLRVFTNQQDVINATSPLLFWMVLFPLLATPCYIWDGVFVGMTASRSMRNTMLLAFAGYLLLYYLVGQHYGNHGLWLSLLLFMVLRGLIQQLWYRRYGLELT